MILHRILNGDLKVDKLPYGVGGFLIVIGNFFTTASWADIATVIGIILGVLTFLVNFYYQRKRTSNYIKIIKEAAKDRCFIPPDK